MSEPNSLMVNDVKYVREDSMRDAPALPLKGQPYVIIRTHGAGVFAGYLAERNLETPEVKMNRCVRLWRWTGCSLSQVASDGIAGTGENKFSVPIDGHIILSVIEIIPCTERARIAIQGVPSWKL